MPDTELDQASAPKVMSLPEVIDVARVGPLRDELQQHRGAALELDGSSVQRIGGLGVQVLLAAQAAWAGDGHPFTLTQASPVLIETLRLTGASLEGIHS